MTEDSLHRPASSPAATRRIALVAHDPKQDLREWADHNRELLSRHALVAAKPTPRSAARLR